MSNHATQLRRLALLATMTAIGANGPLNSAPPSGKPAEKAEPHRAEPARTDFYGEPLPPGAIARLGTIRLRHPKGARSVAFSPDGKILASGGNDCLVRLWDRVSGKELRRLKGQETCIEALAFSPDGKILACGAFNNQPVILWDVASGKEIHRLPGHRLGTPALAFSPDGKRLVTVGDDSIICVRETCTGEHLWSVNTGEGAGAASVVYSPDGRTLLTASGKKPRLRMWDAATGKEIRPPLDETKGIERIALSADGKRLVSVHSDNTVRLWEMASGKEICRFKAEDWVQAMTFAPDGKRVAVAISKGPVRIWEIAIKETRSIPGSTDVQTLAFSPDSKTLAGAEWTTIRLWDAATGKDLFPPQGPQSIVQVLGFAPDGKTLTSVSLDDTVRVWDAASGKELRRGGEGMRAWCSIPTFTPDGRLFLLERRLGEVCLWDATAGTKPRHFKVIPPADPFHEPGGGGVHAAALSSDGKRVAAHDADGTVRVWDVGSGKELSQIKNGVGLFGEMAFSPDGRMLAIFPRELFEAASGKRLRLFGGSSPLRADMAFALDGKLAAVGGSNGVELWDIVRDQRLRELRRPDPSPFFGPIAFAPGGRSVAARTGTSPGGGALWDVRTGKLLRQLTLRADEENDIWVFAFSPDGRILALGMWDETILLWDAFTGQEIRRFRGHQDVVTALAFSADGRKLVSGSRDGTGLIWDLTGGIPAKAPSAEELQILWDDLGGKDAVRADRAFWTLAAAPREAIPLLRERLKTDKRISMPDLGRLIADLDDDRFALREKAERELARLGERAESRLRRALNERPSLEARRRIERLLARLAQKPSEPGPLSVRELRAVRILEQIGTREACEMLERLTLGSADSALAKEAEAALHRCQRRK